MQYDHLWHPEAADQDPVLVVPVFYEKNKTVINNLNRIFIPDLARLLFHSL